MTKLRELERRVEALEEIRIQSGEIGTSARPIHTIYGKSRSGKRVRITVNDSGDGLRVEEI